MTFNWQDLDALVHVEKKRCLERENTKIGPVLEVKVTNRLERYGIEIKIDSTQNDGTLGLWSAGRLTNTENKKRTHYEEVATSAGQLVAIKQKEQFIVLIFIFIFVNDHADQSTEMERHICRGKDWWQGPQDLEADDPNLDTSRLSSRRMMEQLNGEICYLCGSHERTTEGWTCDVTKPRQVLYRTYRTRWMVTRAQYIGPNWKVLKTKD